MGIAELLKDLIANIYLRTAEDDGRVAGTVKDKRVAPKVGNFLHGIVYLLLNRSHETLTLLEQLTLGTEIFLLQVSSFLLLLHYLLLLGLLLLLGEEHYLVLLVLVHGCGLGGESLNLCLPLLAYLIELLVGTLIGRNTFQYVFHVEQGKLLGIRSHGCHCHYNH